MTHVYDLLERITQENGTISTTDRRHSGVHVIWYSRVFKHFVIAMDKNNSYFEYALKLIAILHH